MVVDPPLSSSQLATPSPIAIHTSPSYAPVNPSSASLAHYYVG